MMEIEYLGHSAFVLRDGEREVLIDPFISGNPKAAPSARDVKPDLILVTHAHDDHLGDSLFLSREHDCPILCVFELGEHLRQGGARVLSGNVGGELELSFCSVKMFPAVHTSSFSDGQYGGAACSFLVRMGGKSVYHAGDTALFGDLSLVGDEADIDVALLPVGGLYTMGLRDAVKAMRLLRARTMVPMHYDTWEGILVDREAMHEACRGEGFRLKVLAPGERLVL